MDAKEMFDELEHIGVYIVDKNTLVTYYENKIARKYTGRDRIGEPCYLAHGNSTMCSSCPIRRKNHLSFVNRSDHNMVFAVRCEEIMWQGHESYMISVVKQNDIGELTGTEKSISRMSRGLEKIVDVYTEINIDTMKYRQINLRNSEGYTVDAEGDYPSAFKYMCDNEIHPDDVDEVRRIMNPENLRRLSNDGNGPQEIFARYRLKNVSPTRIMESRAIFMRDEIPHHVVSLAKNVTQEIQLQKQADRLEDILNSVSCGVVIHDVDDEGNVTVEYVNEGIARMSECSKKRLFDELQADHRFSIEPEYRESVKQAFYEIVKGKNKSSVTYYSTTCEGNHKWIEVNYSASHNDKGNLRVYGTFYDCTERIEQQLQLLRNQHAIDFAQKQGSISIWTYNIDKGLIIQLTPTNADGHMGYPVFINHVPECFIENKEIHPDDYEKFCETYRRLTDGEQKVDVVYRMINKTTGKYVWMHMFYQYMDVDVNGDRIAAGFALDASKQQEAIERYHIEQKLRQQMYGDAVMYVEYNLMTGRYEGKDDMPEVYRNQKWECPDASSYLNNMKENVEEEYLEEIVDKLYYANLLKAFMNGENRVVCEYRSKERPGMPSTWYRTTAIMVKRPDTEDVVAFIYIENIDAEKLQQLALQSSMRDGIENIMLIQVPDGKARLIKANSTSRVQKLGEYSIYDDEFVKRSHVRVVDEEKEFSYKAALLSTIISKLETQDIYQYSISMNSLDGSIKRHLFRYRYVDDRKKDIVFSVSDITSVYMEEREKKEQLELALAEVKKASRAKNEFYSRMSHDMRTPMNGILGMTTLSENEDDVNVLKNNIKKIKESGEYLLNLINDTLDLQRIESGRMILEPKIVNAKDIVDSIIDMVGITAKEKGVNLKSIIGNADLNIFIRADELRLKQIFINLISNAIKFTPKDGTVELEFTILEKRDENISHTEICVRDTGIGMSEEFLRERIFTPFSQETNAVSQAYAGSGLGLSIAKSLVELMNGTIEVESELGAGTTFTVHMNFERIDVGKAQNEMDKEKNEKKNFSAVLNDKKILLAEDNELNAEIAKKLLERVGCRVTWVENGKEAVETFANEEVHEFDAILMDIRMPEMNGLDATRNIRALNKEDAHTIPIIAMTANAYEEDRKLSIEAGMNEHLAKPIVPKDMYEVLAKNIQESSFKNG